MTKKLEFTLNGIKDQKVTLSDGTHGEFSAGGILFGGIGMSQGARQSMFLKVDNLKYPGFETSHVVDGKHYFSEDGSVCYVVHINH
ncbi:hypothetical protein ACA593_08755 [Lactiplantibacillus pentosus]|uniref:hypothetical protein n=1 Tax=Lactiplantibacillus pentosus TaxID=1589 RepID=UPI000C7E7E28|nr:hypothetical protein [Lactiplantibacillus pentosus]MCG0634735.1 hypothetical protein [Lactiplantibacillus plantarum]AUI78174.1 hypothetical protein BB562_05420 [Lactiplantibacillus pentosus]MBO9165586.1 hypothetical protein [Lactiplantibacillus pentosus]MBU7465593.1 hypothetical protein [Lactiplantibacillus pentosus]MBU7491484.1 hypothetical protein [Lactiplantibacillus pentosus]